MAAGVSISPISVIGFTCFSLLLVGTTGLKGVPYAVEDELQPLNNLYLVEDVRPHYDDGYVILERHRRQATHNTTVASPPPPTLTSTQTPPTTPTTIPTTTQPTTIKTTIPTTPSTTTTTTTPTTTKITTKIPTSTVLPSSSKPTSPLITHSTVNKTISMTTKSTTPEVTTEMMSGSSDTTNTTGTEEPLLNEEENHKYYWSRIINGGEAESLWVDLDRMSKTGKNTHVTLSNSHRTAATVKLSFVFPFYGHEVDQVTIATGGFLYMSDFLHQWLTATQYIAPLMANFDSQIGNNSHIHYADNGTAFAVQWESVYLQDHQKGPFNFQVILHQDGKVIFGYKDIPVAVESIPNAQHPVKVGLSDAYYVDRNINKEVRRRTIYEYHRVAVPMSRIENNTAVILRPNPTCIAISDCRQCIEANISFACQWCPNAKRCSDGLDRKRQDWLQRRCSQVPQATAAQCSDQPPGSNLSTPYVTMTTTKADVMKPSTTGDQATSSSSLSNTPDRSPFVTNSVAQTATPATRVHERRTPTAPPRSAPIPAHPRSTPTPVHPRSTPTSVHPRSTPIPVHPRSTPTHVRSTTPSSPLSTSLTPLTPEPGGELTVSDGTKPCKEFSSPDKCSKYPAGDPDKRRFGTGADSQPRKGRPGSGFSVGATIAIILMVFLLILIVSWFVYAYKNPTSRSGMWLIDHRPSMLKAKLSKVRFWKRGGDAGEKYEVSMQPEGDSVA